jgi:iron complex outermembrane receptor protein
MVLRKTSLVTLSLLLLSTAFSQQSNDTTKIEEVIIQGSRIQIPFSQVTRDIQVLTSEDIKRLPVKTVNELLGFVSGADVRQRGPFGSQTDISIDGGTFEQTLVLLNGVKLINSQTAHNMMNIPVPLDAIERIEVLKGPAARMYGINALTGAINIVTKKSEKSFVAVNTYAGSGFQQRDTLEGKGVYGGGGLQFTGNFGTKKQSHLVTMSKDYYNGTRYNSAIDNNRIFYNGDFRINNKNSIQLLGGYNYSNFGANGYYASPGDKQSQEIVQTGLVSLSSTHKMGIFTLSPRISNRYDDDDYRYLRYNIDKYRSRHYTNAIMAELNSAVKTKIGEFGLGVESRFESINSSNIGKHDRNNSGISAEYKGFFWKKLVVNAGAYVNYNSSFGWQVYPGADLAYLFLPGWKLSASAGSGQRIPSFTDLYLNQKPGNVGNPNLKPENAWQYEGNIQYTWKTLRVSAGYFYRDISSFIDWVRDSINVPYSPLNVGRNKIQGVNARISQQMSFKKDQQFGYFVSFNYLQPAYISSAGIQSKYVIEALRNQFIVGVNYGIKGFSIQVNNRFIERIKNKGYNLLDLRVAYFIKGFTVYADVSNLLNQTYKEAGAVPMPTRWYSLGFRYAFTKK